MRSIEAARKVGLHCMINMLTENLKESFFLNERKQYDAEKLEKELKALRQTQEDENDQTDSQRKVDQAIAFLEKEELIEDIREKLIEKVIVIRETGLR